MIGTTVDQYEILERIAGGGMGDVFRARDLELDRDVAIKCLRPELSDLEEVTKRFRAEARTLAALSHQNIATVYRFFADNERLFLVMEYIAGRPFGELLVREGAMRPERAVALVGEALRGLGYAHENKVVHRDIKPGNLMLDQRGTVKVLDFGIAHLVGGTRLTRVGSMVGTPAYMAPEQILGKEVDPRSDLYSIGIVLFELLSGELPFVANSNFEIMRAHVETAPRSLADLAQNDVPAALQQVVETALEKQVENRFQTAQEFLIALQKFAGDDATLPLSVALVPAVAGVTTGAEAQTTAASLATEPFSQTLRHTATSLAGKVTARPGVSAMGAAVLVAGASAMMFSGGEATLGESTGVPVYSEQSLVASPAAALSTEPSSTGTVDTANEDGRERIEAPATHKQANSVITPAEPTSEVPLAIASARKPLPRPTAQASVKQAVRAAAGPVAPMPQESHKIRMLKFGAHEVQKTGRASRNAGYNAAFVLSAANDAERTIQVEEVVRVYRSGVFVREQVVASAARTVGQFKTKNRVPDLKTLEPGVYDLELLLRHDGKVLGEARWKLHVRG